MTTIEPTEEQRQAAEAFCVGNLMGYEMQVARLLAEREHKATTLWRANEAAARADARVVMQQAENRCGELRVALNVVEMECERRGEKVLELRAEIARLQALNAEPVAHPELDAARARIAELDAREAAYLAQIKALREMLVSAPGMEMMTALGDVEGGEG